MTLTIVPDVSAALAWCFEDEASEASKQLLGQIGDGAILVPSLWHVEIANALLVAERRQRIDAGAIVEFLSLLEQLEIMTDHAAEYAGFGGLIGLGRQHGLTAYDAAYLDVALRHDLPIATRDKKLRAAAEAAHVGLVDA